MQGIWLGCKLLNAPSNTWAELLKDIRALACFVQFMYLCYVWLYAAFHDKAQDCVGQSLDVADPVPEQDIAYGA